MEEEIEEKDLTELYELKVEAAADCIEVVLQTIESKMKAADDIMSIYMSEDLGRYKDRVDELHLLWTMLRSVKESIEENYFEHLDNLKREHKVY